MKFPKIILILSTIVFSNNINAEIVYNAPSCFGDSYTYSGALTVLGGTGSFFASDPDMTGSVYYDSCSHTGSFTLDNTVNIAGLDFSFSTLNLNANQDGSVHMSGNIQQMNSPTSPFAFSYDFAASVLQDDEFGVTLDLLALDGDVDGVPGNAVTTGAWTGLSGIFTGTFNNLGNNGNNFPTYSPVPVPAAAWLFSSGLIGLIGFARRKKV